MMIIKSPLYQNYENTFIDSNDSIMALLVASQLTSDYLDNHPDRTTLLPLLLERVPDIKRLNRSPEDATIILAKSESHLANMAVVYILAVHQTFMDDAVEFMKKHGYEVIGRDLEREPAAITSENVYRAMEDCFGAKLDADLLEQFNFVRRIRNRIIHYGGDAGYKLLQESKLMTLENQGLWEKRMGRSLKELLSHERIELKFSELIGVLALSRRVVIEVQDLLAVKIDRHVWANLAVKDYAEENPIRFKNIERRVKHVQGYAASFYSGLGLTKDELEEAIDLYVSSVEEVTA